MLLCYFHFQPKRQKETSLDGNRNVQTKEPPGNEMADDVVYGHNPASGFFYNLVCFLRPEIVLWSLFSRKKNLVYL